MYNKVSGTYTFLRLLLARRFSVISVKVNIKLWLWKPQIFKSRIWISTNRFELPYENFIFVFYIKFNIDNYNISLMVNESQAQSTHPGYFSLNFRVDKIIIIMATIPFRYFLTLFRYKTDTFSLAKYLNRFKIKFKA
jgi:hypothetical protein